MGEAKRKKNLQAELFPNREEILPPEGYEDVKHVQLWQRAIVPPTDALLSIRVLDQTGGPMFPNGQRRVLLNPKYREKGMSSWRVAQRAPTGRWYVHHSRKRRYLSNAEAILGNGMLWNLRFDLEPVAGEGEVA